MLYNNLFNLRKWPQNYYWGTFWCADYELVIIRNGNSNLTFGGPDKIRYHRSRILSGTILVLEYIIQRKFAPIRKRIRSQRLKTPYQQISHQLLSFLMIFNTHMCSIDPPFCNFVIMSASTFGI